ncbi:MAG: cytochrome P450, partial [Gaiellaceae bacterium]
LAEHAIPELRMLGESTLLFIDPPAHSRLRALVSKAFTPRRIAGLRVHIEHTTDAVLDALATAGEFDLLREIAEPLPILAITHLLGVPDADWSQLHRWTTAITAFNELPVDFGALAGANAAASEFNGYCRSIIAARRSAPGDDLVSALIAAEDDGQRLSADEVIGMLILLLMAGHDTTKSMISSGVRELLRHPAQAKLLREDPTIENAAIEELLRYESPLHVASGGGRWIADPIVLHGVTLEPGVPVRLLLGSANRDPEIFDDPDTLRLGRDARPHLAFGKGVHFCLGAALGRLEGQVIIPKILRRFPDLTLVRDDLAWRPSMVTRQLAELPVARRGAT